MPEKPLRHVYSCPLRWGDMDSFGHVNNVTWADYLQEARWDFLAATGCTDLNFVVLAGQRLQYLAPLTFDGQPVSVEVWVAAVGEKSFSLAYEVFRSAPDGGRTVYLRAYATHVAFNYTGDRRTRPLTDAERSALGGRLEETPHEKVAWDEPRRDEQGYYPVTVRFSDIDWGGIVSNVKYLEFFQEARIGLLTNQLEQVAPGTPMPGIVVAQADVEYVAPILYRPEPYDCHTWVSELGTKSMVLQAEIRDGDQVKSRGRFALVWFDLASGRAVEPDPALRTVLESGLL